MRRLANFAAAALLAACASNEAPDPGYEVVVRVSGDPGQPIAGATIAANGAKVGATHDDGSAKLKFRGAEGDQVDVAVTCPAGHQSPAKPLTITLHKTADPHRRPEYEVACPPTTRTVVVAVRADDGPNLPVMYLGKEVARTDASGAAHVLLRLGPTDTFELTLGTGEKGSEQLRPQNPVASFAVKGRDDVFTFDQRFTIEPKRGGGRRHTGPRRL